MTTEERVLREAFTEAEIAKENSCYPTSVQRPKIYRAMQEYAQKENQELIGMLEP